MEAKPYSEQPELHANAPYRAAQLTYPGNLRQALKDAMADPSKALMGVASGIPSTFVTKLLASTKPDFIFFDVEHGMFNRLELYDAIHAAQHHSEGRTMVIVRVPKHDEISLSTALDAGASGIVFPHIESAEEVKQLIKNMYYGPIGHRSFSPWTFTPGISDASLFPGDPFNLATSNQHVCIIPQIESVKGVENVDEIAAVEGVHGLMFGSGDFSIDAGLITGDFFTKPPHPTLLAALGKFGAAAAKNNLPTMSFALNSEMAPMLLQAGYRLIATPDTWTLTKAIQGFLQGTREAAKKLAADANETLKAENPNEEVNGEVNEEISSKEPSSVKVKA